MPIKLLFSGDFAPLISVNEIHNRHFSGIKHILTESDLHITNLECPLTNSNKKIFKTGPHIKASPESVELLKQANVGLACLANNHIFDFNEEGILDTVNICKHNNIPTIGIVNRSDGLESGILIYIKGKSVAFLNYCEHEFSVREEGKLGANGFEEIKCFYDIQKYKAISDFIVIIYHGGHEYFNLPSPYLKKLFHYLIDLGADAVISHHAHVLSGYEIYLDKPIIYGLGNFFFPYPNEPELWYFGILCRILINDKIDFELIPIYLRNETFSLELLPFKKNIEYKDLIERYSKIIKDDNLLKIQWENFADSLMMSFIKKIPFFPFYFKILMKLKVPASIFLPINRMISFYNLMRCKSHNLLLHYTFKKIFKNER